MSASLQGTLQGGLASAEDEQARLMQAIAQQAGLASQGEQQAGRQLQQAAQAPMPDVNPMGAFIQTLMGNTASVIGETPDYRESAQALIKEQRNVLLARRAQNLAALQDTYDKKFQLAKSANDLDNQVKWGKATEQVAKAQALVLESLHQEEAQRDRDAAQKRTETQVQGGITEAGIRARTSGKSQEDSELKALYAGLPTSTSYQTALRMLGAHAASSKTNTDEVAKTLVVARALALERNKSDRTPDQFTSRIRRFNAMVKRLQTKDKGKPWKKILNMAPAAADTVSTAEINAAMVEQFPEFEFTK